MTRLLLAALLTAALGLAAHGGRPDARTVAPPDMCPCRRVEVPTP